MTKQKIDTIEDEIDILEIYKFLFTKKNTIAIYTIFCILLGGIFVFILPNIYKSELVLVPSFHMNSNNKSSNLISSLGVAGGLLGINDGKEVSEVEKNLAILRSKLFLYDFFAENNMLPILFADDWDETNNNWINADEPITLLKAYEFFIEEILFIDKDLKTGIVRLSIEWTDPELTTSWANKIIVKLNEDIRIRDIQKFENFIHYLENELIKTSVKDRTNYIYNLIEQETQNLMLAISEEEYAFKVIDKAVVPEKKVRPRRAFILIGFAFGGCFIGIFVAFFIGRHKP
ncbi:MAG: Wzz/FepE/Etk N-terminal domain-containing protein [Emcibacteraceae bacterium]|nr:Wzz/FepE/Etk N-terminal domain-containing protein [Emcibacteraceae bacterium]